MNEKYPLALPKGTVLAGQYIVERVLGQGGFGITYEAKDHKTDQRVAVKEFFPDGMAARTTQTTVSPFSGERGESFAYGKTCFLQEAETLAKFIGNENIVRIHSYFEENGTAYFVMDFIEGTSFDDYLKQHGGKIPYEEAAQILVPVMDALSTVHSAGIVHRDVTPDNIYITREGVVKLLDFGAARYSLGDKSRSLDIILKHGFAPKEQYTRRGKQGPYTDIYALGATFYFALTGKRPPDSVERMDEDDLVPPSSLGVQLSAAEEDAILKALSIQPADRFQNMMAFKSALLNLQQSAAAQPAMAAVGGQGAVVQTFFSAPEQPGTSLSSGPVGGPAPEGGQNTELQDLAATMKTAGKLTGKLAGQMVGKLAEKTAETAGVMAGTAGKMSGIMAAKKAETMEKLAAKTAERKAEKAAQAAELEAKREAERSAAQAAEAPVENTGEDAIGKTVGVTAGSVSGSAPAKTAAGKKNKLLLLAPIAAVILIAVLVLKPGGTGQGNASPDAGSTSGETADISDTPTGDFSLVSNPGNIMNFGLITVDDNGYFNYVDHNGASLYSNAEGRFLFENEGSGLSNLSYDDGKLFFLNSYSAYAYNPETREVEDVPYLDEFTGSIQTLLLTEDYYVIGCPNDMGSTTVYLISRTTGQQFECCTVTGVNGFTISGDGFLYYISNQEGSGMGIYSFNLSTWERKGLSGTTDPDTQLYCPVVAGGDYLYFSTHNKAANTNYGIFKINRTTGDILCYWEINSQLDITQYGNNLIYAFNVNPFNGDIYVSVPNADTGTYDLFEMTGYDNGTFDLKQISQQALAPNITYTENGGYRLYYFSLNKEQNDFRLYYRDYDADGTPVQN